MVRCPRPAAWETQTCFVDGSLTARYKRTAQRGRASGGPERRAPAPGLLGYGAVAALAAREFAARASRRRRSQREANLARYATLAAGTVLASTSGYLLFILATKFPGDSCTWCLTSAALSAAVFGSALRGFSGRCAVPSLASGAGRWQRLP